MNMQADVVKKANLKLKVVRNKTGSCAAGLQGPKVFKEFWFVFRSLVGGDKILEYHQSERKFQESAAYPKGVLHLGSAVAVSYHNPEKKQQFSIELADGAILFLEAGTQAQARDWMNCLNAVLFGKGTGPNGSLQYFVEVTADSRLQQYAGPCLLEVRGEDLTVKTNDGVEVLVQWKLAHIRSFKAKKNTLTVYSGSRSSTGVGEYYFKTSQSVQITHAIETVVKRLKCEAQGGNQQMHHSVSAPGITQAHPFSSERQRPLPPPPFHSTPGPTASPPHPSSPGKVSLSSTLAAVPNHIPSEFLLENEDPDHRRKNVPSFRVPEYSVVGDVCPTEGYQRLDHGVRSEQKSLSPPRQPSEGYSRLKHSHQSAPLLPQPRNTSRSRSVSRSPPLTQPPDQHDPTDDYGRLNHGLQAAVPSSEDYSKLNHGAVGQAKGTHAASSGDQYSKLDRGGREAIPSSEEYGRLDHGINSQAPCSDDYSKLGTPPPVMGNKTLPIPAPYKPRSGSPLPQIIRDLNAVHTSESGASYAELANTTAPGRHGYDEVAGDMYDEVLNTTVVDRRGYDKLSNTTVAHTADMYEEVSDTTMAGHHDKYDDVVSPTVAGAQGGDVYSEVGPSIPKVKVSEGYERLNHSTGIPAQAGSTAQTGGAPGATDNNSTPLPTSSRQLSVKYRRLGPPPRPQSVIDPYASLSDANISDISAALRQGSKPGEGGYSQLQLVAPSGRSHEVDETGYSRPWTSFNASAGAKTNNTPKPSLTGPAPPARNGLQTRSAIGHHANQNGTETGSTADQPEFEALYDKVGGKDEDNPPAPPPRRGSQHSQSPPAPRKWSKRAKKPLPSS